MGRLVSIHGVILFVELLCLHQVMPLAEYSLRGHTAATGVTGIEALAAFTGGTSYCLFKEGMEQTVCPLRDLTILDASTEGSGEEGHHNPWLVAVGAYTRGRRTGVIATAKKGRSMQWNLDHRSQDLVEEPNPRNIRIRHS
jgi:hypothetical protein